MHRLFLLMFLGFSVSGMAQHCPWDCSGLLLLQTDVSKEKIYRMNPVLVDENKKIIIDTIYGTGRETNDTCRFLYYDDFVDLRTKKMSLHGWYGNDTAYHFASGNFVVRFNYCEYEGSKLYLRFTDPYSHELKYQYKEIPDSNRIHLHKYSREIGGRKTAAIKNALRNVVFNMKCGDWLMRQDDCK